MRHSSLAASCRGQHSGIMQTRPKSNYTPKRCPPAALHTSQPLKKTSQARARHRNKRPFYRQQINMRANPDRQTEPRVCQGTKNCVHGPSTGAHKRGQHACLYENSTCKHGHVAAAALTAVTQNKREMARRRRIIQVNQPMVPRLRKKAPNLPITVRILCLPSKIQELVVPQHVPKTARENPGK